MIKILFICHGNICRSPMAEYVMKDMTEKAGLGGRFEIASAAARTDEIGSDVYPPARQELERHGVACPRRRARLLKKSDFEYYDMVIGMDAENLRDLHRVCGEKHKDKIGLLMDFTPRPGSVADPWYTGDFGATWRDVSEGCRCLLERLSAAEKI